MSNIPVRRMTRITRGTTKDNENTNARSTRTLVRVKAGANDAPTARQTTAAPSAGKAKAGDEKAVGKRKREVLVEVTGVSNNNRKAKDEGKGKGKEAVGEGIPAKVKPFGKIVTRPNPAVAAHRSSKSTTADTTAGQGTSDSTSAAEVARPAVFARKISLRAIDEVENDRAAKRRHTEESTRLIEDDSQAEADRIAAELVDLDQEVEVEVDVTKEKKQEWDDLDAGDWDDPMMVSEYVAEVCIYLKEIEIQTRPNPAYMTSQPEIDWEKRGVLVDWVLQVHARFNLLQETLFLFTNILDRFLSLRPISLSKLQLVGITAFFIAAKFEETYAPSVAEIAHLAEKQYTVAEILKAERYILKTLDWDLRYPGPMGWLRRGSKADDCDVHARTVGKYLIEIGCLEWRLVGTLPSLLAAAAMWLGRLVLCREEWPVQHESLFKKYAHKRYLKCSAFMRHWVLERWPENTVVDLKRDLPGLKAEVVHEHRKREAEAVTKP